jgi:hypothetical protein
LVIGLRTYNKFTRKGNTNTNYMDESYEEMHHDRKECRNYKETNDALPRFGTNEDVRMDSIPFGLSAQKAKEVKEADTHKK